MAGPMVGPLLDVLPARAGRRPTGSPTASSPTTSPTRCWRRTASSSSTRCCETGADLGIAWDGDADRCFFIDDTGEFVAGDFLTALLAESMLRKEPGATILYDVRASRAVRDVVERAGGTRRGEPRGPRLLQDAHARRPARPSAARCRATTTSATSTAPTRARCPALLILELLSVEGKTHERAARAAALALLHLGRDQLRGRGPGGQDEGDRRALLRRRGRPARRRLGRLRRLALQRAALQHRAAAAAQPRVARLAPSTWRRSATRCWRSASIRALAARRASTGSPSRRRSPSAGSTST